MRFRQNCECGPAAMKAVTSALASGAITPGEAERIAAVVGTFVWSIETSDFERRLKDAEDGLTVTTHRGIFAVDLLQVQQTEIISSNIGCNSGGRALPEIHADKLAAVLRFASRGHSG
jgi:hypothetical protein